MINADAESKKIWKTLTDEEKVFLIMYCKLSEKNKKIFDAKLEEYVKLYGTK